jgi:3-methyladenine DNA glycosylase AlkC
MPMIPAERLGQLNSGTVASTTLSEGLAVNFTVLLRSILPRIPGHLLQKMADASSLGVSKRMVLAGTIVHAAVGRQGLAQLGVHPSDTARAWVGFALAHDFSLNGPDAPLQILLDDVRPLADDPHFGVREWAWMAVRPHMANQLETAIQMLAGWTDDPSERIRRFASESTRPRGVWCAHLNSLKDNPAMGLPILEPLRNDPAPYVQDSVGNWLNDAAKSQPAWVEQLCERWLSENSGKGTERICKRALRSIKK